MRMHIRPATRDDVALLAEIICHSFKDVADRFELTPDNAPTHPSNCTPDWISSAFDKGARYFVLEYDGDACACVEMECAGPEHCYLERLAVMPAYRFKGIGKKLVHHIAEEARAQGLSRIEIGIIAEHTQLRRWYESLGFETIETKSFSHLPFQVTFMVLRLSDE